MISQEQYLRLQNTVFAASDRAIYAVLDGALIENLPQRVSTMEAACLFATPLDPVLEAAAPQLVRISRNGPCCDLALREGWNTHWGIVLETSAETDLASLRAHLRRNLRVRGPDGRPLLFRFYDPRAFRTVVPTMDAEQRRAFFGPVAGCYVEGRTPETVLYFSRDGGAAPRPLSLIANARDAGQQTRTAAAET